SKDTARLRRIKSSIARTSALPLSTLKPARRQHSTNRVSATSLSRNSYWTSTSARFSSAIRCWAARQSSAAISYSRARAGCLFITGKIAFHKADFLKDLAHAVRQILQRDPDGTGFADRRLDGVAKRELAVPVAHVAGLVRCVLSVVGKDEKLPFVFRDSV